MGCCLQALADLDAADALLPGHPFTLKARVAVRSALGDKSGASADSMLIHRLTFPKKQAARPLRPARKPKRKGPPRASGRTSIAPSLLKASNRPQQRDSSMQGNQRPSTQNAQPFKAASTAASAAAAGSVQVNLKRAEQQGRRSRQSIPEGPSRVQRGPAAGDVQQWANGISGQRDGDMVTHGPEDSHSGDFGAGWNDSDTNTSSSSSSWSSSTRDSSRRRGSAHAQSQPFHSPPQNLAPQPRREPGAWLDDFGSSVDNQLEDAGHWQLSNAPTRQVSLS